MPFGSLDGIVLDAISSGVDVTERWVSVFTTAVAGRHTAGELFAAVEAARKQIDPLEFMAVVEPAALHSSMLGVLDAGWEAEEDEVVEQDTENVAASALRLEAPPGFDPGFAFQPFPEALEAFLAREPVTRSTWLQMTAEAKGRAFTVAGLTEKRLVADVHAELAKSIEAGEDLRAFRTRLRERMASRGWLRAGRPTEVPTRPGSPWHVETIFRNGVRSSYSTGRHRQMSQPHILAARPFWQIRTVPDSARRPEHAKLHGLVLAADDAFWKRAGLPPWDHNCRCRVVSRSARDLSRRGWAVTSGSDIEGVPAEGWTSATMELDAAELPPAAQSVVKIPSGDGLPETVEIETA